MKTIWPIEKGDRSKGKRLSQYVVGAILVVNDALGAKLIPEISCKKNQQVFQAVHVNGNFVLKKAYGFAELFPSHDQNNFVVVVSTSIVSKMLQSDCPNTLMLCRCTTFLQQLDFSQKIQEHVYEDKGTNI